MKVNKKKLPDNKDDFYNRLKEKLKENSNWPLEYMYKFIVPNKEGNEKKVKIAFDKDKIQYKTNHSKTGKYISITVITTESSVDDIINKYRTLEKIDGLVAL